MMMMMIIKWPEASGASDWSMAEKGEERPLLEKVAEEGRKRALDNRTIEGKPVLATDDESRPQLLDRLQLGFPVYAVDYSAATSTLFVAGGGGPAKTGVRNSIVTSLLRLPLIISSTDFI